MEPQAQTRSLADIVPMDPSLLRNGLSGKILLTFPSRKTQDGDVTVIQPPYSQVAITEA